MILPIGHEKAVNRFPWVTIAIILINTVIFFVTIPVSINQMRKIEELEREKAMMEIENRAVSYQYGPEGQIIPGGKDSDHDRLKDLESRLENAEASLLYRKYGYIPSRSRWYTLLTSLFLHAGFLHLIGNMWFLYLIGTSIEDVWGRRYFLAFYLASGVLACLLHGIVYQDSQIPVVGASGAIAALMGAFMIRNYRVRVRFFYFFLIFIYPLYGTFCLPAYVALGGWFAMQLFFGAISLGCAAGVAYWAHIGGFLVGTAVAILFKTQKIEERYIAPKLEERLEAVKLHPKLVQAFEARDRGNLEEASRLLQELILIESNNIDAHTELANIYISAEDLKSAGSEYDKIVTILWKSQDVDSMIETYRHVVELGLANELSPPNQFRIGTVLSERELFEEALDVYRNLIKNYPDHELAPLSVFKCAKTMLRRLNKPKLAYAAFQYILENYPEIDWKDEVFAEMEAK